MALTEKEEGRSHPRNLITEESGQMQAHNKLPSWDVGRAQE